MFIVCSLFTYIIIFTSVLNSFCSQFISRYWSQVYIASALNYTHLSRRTRCAKKKSTVPSTHAHTHARIQQQRHQQHHLRKNIRCWSIATKSWNWRTHLYAFMCASVYVCRVYTHDMLLWISWKIEYDLCDIFSPLLLLLLFTIVAMVCLFTIS